MSKCAKKRSDLKLSANIGQQETGLDIASVAACVLGIFMSTTSICVAYDVSEFQ